MAERRASWPPEGAFAERLQRARIGDADAISRLYRDMAPVVLGYLRAARVPNPEDVASEVFVSMVGDLRHFEGGERDFQAWLLTIAHRRRVDEWRRQGRNHEDPGLSEELISWPASPDAADAAIGRLEARGALEAMDHLTDDQRSVLMLRILADLSVPEIARITGKTEPAVKALLRRALAAMDRSLRQPQGSVAAKKGRPGGIEPTTTDDCHHDG